MIKENDVQTINNMYLPINVFIVSKFSLTKFFYPCNIKKMC